MSSLTIIDSGTGNSRSVQLALRAMHIAAQVSFDPRVIYKASALIFPGVGAAHRVMRELKERGIADVLRAYINEERPLLAICVGAQLLLERTEEGNTPGLGIFKGRARLFAAHHGMKVPHMGWNQVRYRPGHPLFSAIPQNQYFYFVHSYYTAPTHRREQVAWCRYGVHFPAAFGRAQIYALQFHPEKSGKYGLQLLKNFAHTAHHSNAVRRGYRAS